MTIESTIRRNDYIGNGLIAAYDYVFKIFAPDHLTVITADLDGVETVLPYPTGFQVTGVGRANGGTVTLSSGALPALHRLAIIRRLPLNQTTDLRNLGGYFPDTTENQLDKFAMILQQLMDYIDHSIKAPSSLDFATLNLTTPDPEPGKAIGWAPDGVSLVNLATLEGDENGPFVSLDGHVPMTGPLQIEDDFPPNDPWSFAVDNGTYRVTLNSSDVFTAHPTAGMVIAGLLFARAGGQGIGRVTCSSSAPPSDGEAGDLHFQF